MRVFDFPGGIVAFLAFVAMIPAAMYYVTDAPGLASLSVEGRLLAGFAVPIFALLMLGSWAQSNR